MSPPEPRPREGGLAPLLLEALPRLYATAADPALQELIAALAAALERGSLELDLEGPPPPQVEPAGWPERHRAALARSPLAAPHAPLVLVDGRHLRWRRWHGQMEAVLEALVQRALTPLEPLPEQADLRQARQAAAARGLDPQQQQAVVAALRGGLLLLGGGPGTGKTSTVVEILASQLRRQPALRLHLAAPTGKAATRLQEAVRRGAADLEPPLRKRLGPISATTLHRLLESNGERFGRHRRHPLDLDLLVVDELSMVDLPLMEALLEALPAPARLVLVGDPAQLPPVGPGAVLLELQRPERQEALGEACVLLRTTYRNAGAIADLAQELRHWSEPGLRQLAGPLAQLPPQGNLRWHPARPADGLPAAVLEPLRRRQRQLERLATAAGQEEEEGGPALEALLAALGELLVLAPLRRGRWGVETIHAAVLGASASGGAGRWPVGTPVLCCRNLPDLGLANGDLGVLLRQPHGEVRLVFGQVLRLHPAQLEGAVEPALALTVHKAQGSEAERVIVLLSDLDQGDPRLLYTALTRARREALLITPPLP
ncbi:MAG: AAA family ATPase [Synechococcus sp.]|nr:AAA family ATPase [Synechococcus sp.]